MSARQDYELTRCTCGSWVFLGETCADCGVDEVLSPYINGLTSRGAA